MKSGFVMRKCSTSFWLLLLALLFIGCTGTKEPTDSSPFEYREVYSPELASGESLPLRLNNVDRDWGIWGHNLSAVLPENPSAKVYAKSGSSVNYDQFCFSSDALFKYIKEYIDNNYGSKKTMRFAILPNDNSVVCRCKQCVECGNTESDGSGAVYYLLDRLTKQFPNHLFFTSCYRSMCSMPNHPLPENAGVLISAINFPLCATHTPEEDVFLKLLVQWSSYTKRIYVWDYINNFDDYFTPLPIFNIFRHRLQLYAKAGVKGVFLNGSGNDYSTFYRLKIHVLATLLSNPDADWHPVLKEFCMQRYPVTGQVIYDFVSKQEDMVRNLNKPVSLYEGVSTAMKTYLPADEFIAFHNKLCSLLPETKGEEYKRIKKISRATMLTHLELKRIAADTTGCKQMLRELEQFSADGYIAYSEAGGTLESYVKDYRFMLRYAEDTWAKNLLRGVKLEPLTALDEDYNDISILTDGLLGLPSCYHCGQLLSSATPALRISIPYVQGMTRLRVNMTKNSIYHISLPLRVSLTANVHELGSVVPTPSSSNLQRAVAEFNIPSNCGSKLELVVYRNQEDRTMALDEIEGF
ncbi:MAG: DUF4838 domain-containing protein [Bacteroidaceae bacterium]|nr:DUF4838 domain-containing protein [Bacteroidaceae bacterium]